MLVYVVYSPKSGMSECVVCGVVIFVNVAFGRGSWLEIQVGATGLREVKRKGSAELFVWCFPRLI